MANTEEPVNTPEWILRLENKNKRTHKLAHEIGAGASCLQCNSCPGLDLHFWRKLCKKCKCKKEEHDVKDDDGSAQFEILLGVGHKKQTSKRAYLNIRVTGTGIENVPTAAKGTIPSTSKNPGISFDWVPPDVDSDLAGEYMLQLPASKLPISGSDGAQYRRMQLEKQVPIHDLDASKCHGLTPVEVDRMQAYVDEIKSNVVGQGRVTKFDPVKYEEQRLKHSVPQTRIVSGEPVLAHGVRQSSRDIAGHNATAESLRNSGSSPSSTASPSSLHSKGGEPDSPPPPLPTNPPPLFDPAIHSNLGDFASLPGQRLLKTPGALIPTHLGGYSSENKGKENEKAPCHIENQGSPSSREEMEWPPPPSQEEMSLDDRSATVRGPGDSFKTVGSALPDLMSGLTIGGCGDAGGPQWKCHRCKEIVSAGEVVVVAERAGANICWHPNCFSCNICKELLVDLIYFYSKGEVFCGRHFAEIMNIPRCNACDELIFVPNYTSAEGRSFHVKHFCCFECDIPLGGMKYILVDDQPNCLNCYQNKYGKTCHTCKQPIAAGDKRVSLKELHWHVSEQCFCCSSCKKFLLGGKFTVKDNQPFCSRTCVETYFCPQTAL